jgi:hypothetical protein
MLPLAVTVPYRRRTEPVAGRELVTAHMLNRNKFTSAGPLSAGLKYRGER